MDSIRRLSKRLILSYLLDWASIALIAGVGKIFNDLGPRYRPFSLADLTISFPHIEETVSETELIVASLVVPGAIIMLVCLLFIPGPGANKGVPRALVMRRKLWEWHTGWLGLALTMATNYLATEGMKNIFGKPRPDLISRCDPDIANFADHIVTAYSENIDERWVLVSPTICRTTDQDLLDGGFKSFPSGHSSTSFAGLIYLTLFFCSKFAIAIPFLSPRPFSRDLAHTSAYNSQRTSPENPNLHAQTADGRGHVAVKPGAERIVPIRNQAAAPPIYLLALVYLPLGGAVFISATRFSDYRHFGFDIISGALIGIASAWLGFRWYHLPIRQGAGWAWGARSRDRAFGIGVGIGNYVGAEGWESKKFDGDKDLERGVMNGHEMLGPGTANDVERRGP